MTLNLQWRHQKFRIKVMIIISLQYVEKLIISVLPKLYVSTPQDIKVTATQSLDIY